MDEQKVETAENEEKVETAEETEAAAETAPELSHEDQLNQLNDRLLRTMAEYDNFRKRSSREQTEIALHARVLTISAFLSVYDNLERALAQQTEDQAFFKGVELTMAELLSVMSQLGVEKIDAKGQTFDPELHNAVMHIEDENFGQSEVVEQFQVGFKLTDRVIRHAVVKVAN